MPRIVSCFEDERLAAASVDLGAVRNPGSDGAVFAAGRAAVAGALLREAVVERFAGFAFCLLVAIRPSSLSNDSIKCCH
jgi:hypothetical protein